jgi:SAM-dependent methyltransferase
MELTYNKLSSKLLSVIFKELLKGKSLYRTLLNYSLSEIELSGSILDLGSKSNSASYNRFLKYIDPYKVTYTDWHQEGEDIIKLNLEEKFSVSSENFDTVTCFNVLEHIYNYKNLASESNKILKSGGIFVGGTPFLVNYHKDPHDYYRYTHESLEKIFGEVGFVCKKIVYLGFGPMSASFSISMNVYPKFLRPFFAIITILLDGLLLKIKKNQRLKYPLGYLFVMKKK